jgi:hypothetical protein
MLNKHWLISMPYLDRGFTQIEEGQVEEATGPDVIVHMGLNALDVEALKFVLSQVEDGVLEVPEEYIPTLNSILEGLRQLAEQTVRWSTSPHKSPDKFRALDWPEWVTPFFTVQPIFPWQSDFGYPQFFKNYLPPLLERRLPHFQRVKNGVLVNFAITLPNGRLISMVQCRIWSGFRWIEAGLKRSWGENYEPYRFWKNSRISI